MRRTPSAALLARRLAPLAAVVVAVGLSGCQVSSPIQTDVPYVPADGVPVDLGQVQIRNLVIVAKDKDGNGTISGSVYNKGGDAATVTFAGQGGSSATFEVPAYTEKQISKDSPVVLPKVTGAPGGVTTLQVSTAASGSNVAEVPILLPQGYYESLAPQGTSTTP